MLLAMSTSLMADGTEPTGNPRQVTTLDHLLWISTNSSSWGDDYIQTADIDATGTSSWDSGAGFSPIGNGSTMFTGSYDGQGHTIAGLFINRSSLSFVGLFGYINGGDISNVGVINVNITGNISVGGLVGKLSGSTLSHSYATGSVSGNEYVGGLAGTNYSMSNISNSYSRSAVNGGSKAGGLVGYNIGAEIINSYSTGAVSGDSYVGGLIGRVVEAYADWCFWDTMTSGQTSSADGIGKTTAEMQNACTFLSATWDFADETENGSDDDWSINSSDNSGYPALVWQGFANSLPACVPESQSTNIIFSNVAFDGMQIDWTNGNGVGRAVFVKATDTGEAAAVDETTYTANTAFGTGTQIGTTGWYCVYNGTGTTVTVTGLSASTAYRAHVVEYNGSAGSEVYLTAAGTENPANQTTAVLLFSGGSGTELAPYQIANLDDLQYLSEHSGYWGTGIYFIQTADIDATETSDWNNDAGFSPIGSSAIKFTGEYNGGNFTID